MYLVGKVKTVYTDGPSWDAVKLCRTKWGAVKACVTIDHGYVKIGFKQLPPDAPFIHPLLRQK